METVYLDTHVIVWLYAGETDRLSVKAGSLIEKSQLCYSSFSKLELAYLYEIERITVAPQIILEELQVMIGLTSRDSLLKDIIVTGMPFNWTRDPFDRLITAQAILTDTILLTKDRNILDNCRLAVW